MVSKSLVPSLVPQGLGRSLPVWCWRISGSCRPKKRPVSDAVDVLDEMETGYNRDGWYWLHTNTLNMSIPNLPKLLETYDTRLILFRNFCHYRGRLKTLDAIFVFGPSLFLWKINTFSNTILFFHFKSLFSYYFTLFSYANLLYSLSKIY